MYSYILFAALLSLTSGYIVFKPESSSKWDLLIFTQHWPVSACKQWKEENNSNKCYFPANQETWTIHGIWPTRLGSMGPEFCNRTWHFDPDQVKPIETNLTQQWIDIRFGGQSYSLWAHEWNKHGTCAAAIENLNSEYKYFNEGLVWLDKYLMTDILTNAGIVPSNSKEYLVTDIHKALKQKLGVNPVIECKKMHGRDYLFELRICFDKNLKLHDCDGVIKSKLSNSTIITNCHTASVVYPTNVEHRSKSDRKIIVQLYKLTSWLQWFTL